MIHILSFKKLKNIILKINFIPKTIKKSMNFIVQLVIKLMNMFLMFGKILK